MSYDVLFIAEKPSLAKAIAEGLGVTKRENGYFVCRSGAAVTWCFGHLLELAEPDDYLPDDVPKTKKGKKVWRMRDLPIFPSDWKSLPKTDKGAKAQLSVIGKLIRSSDLIVNAGDPDREGQLLVDEVLEHFKCRKPVKRFWVSAVDPASIKKGLASLRENADYAGMRDAARGRTRADWLIGMNLSRAYTLSYAENNGERLLVAVGRVQTPTLTMVARRDYAVRNFVPKPYFALSAVCSKSDQSFRAKWKPKPDQPGMDEEGKLLLDLKLGAALLDRLSRERTARVISCETKRKKVPQPKVFSLADIQIEANRRYGLTAEETLRVCQSLYEKHKITSYPRTDCGHLPESQHAEASAVLAAVASTFPAAAKAVERADVTIKSPTFDDKKITAHHGIVPVANAADWNALSENEQRIYVLLAKRYVAQFFPAHEYDETVALLDIGGETFVAKGKVVVRKGWKALYAKEESSESGDGGKKDERDEQALPVLKTGDSVRIERVEGKEDKTKPPAYFTEGTLIAAMENIWRSFDDPKLRERLKESGGIGTPATRAAIIQELKRKEYLETDGKKLHCSELGRKVLQSVSPKVRSAALTAAFETKLRLVEKGECTLDSFVAQYEDFIRGELASLEAESPESD